MTDDARILRLAQAFHTTPEAAARLVAAGHGTPRKVEALDDSVLLALVGEVPPRVARARAARQARQVEV